MASEKDINTNQVLAKIAKTIEEIKNGIPASNLSVEDVKHLQKDLDKVRQLALKIKAKFR